MNEIIRKLIYCRERLPLVGMALELIGGRALELVGGVALEPLDGVAMVRMGCGAFGWISFGTAG